VIVELIVSTIAFFAATWFLRMRFDEMDIPKGMTRSATIFGIALLVSYAAAAAVDWLAGHA
jgi:hypothetical protein